MQEKYQGHEIEKKSNSIFAGGILYLEDPKHY